MLKWKGREKKRLWNILWKYPDMCVERMLKKHGKKKS
jgi:hypothetical protein